jgi:DNA mismatch repair protein MutL
VCEDPHATLVVVDSHALRERILFHALSDLQQGEVRPARQPALFTTLVELPPEEVAQLLAARDVLGPLQLELEAFGPGALVVRSLPAVLEACELPRVLEALAQNLGRTGNGTLDDVALAEIACVAAGDRDTTLSEGQALLAQADDFDGGGAGKRPKHHRVVAAELPLLELLGASGRR